ncbi:MAG: aminotransferase class V-fold PLP-dependent enzyme [Planctomycetota bacterium]
MEMTYLDHNATTRPEDEVVAATQTALTEHWANPSSIHRPGQQARQQVELARKEVGKLINARPRDIIFTSGGTEGANLSIHGSLIAQPDRPVIVTVRTEHSAVRQAADRYERKMNGETIWVNVSVDGVIDLDHLKTILGEHASRIGIVSVMWANNETGVIQPVEAIGELCREHGVRYHVDGVQWVGKLPTNIADMPIDLLSFAGHKYHGPKGAGGLFIRTGIEIEPYVIGGSHERDLRGGTENVPGIVGLGVASRLAREWLETNGIEEQRAKRDRFEQTILEQVDETRVNGGGADRVWNTTNIAFRRLEAEAMLLLMSERGVAASAGSACSSGSLDPSPVLMAMGIEDTYAHGSVRFSICRHTTDEEVDRALEVVPAVVAKLRKSMASV